jgi:hypothetical protein
MSQYPFYFYPDNQRRNIMKKLLILLILLGLLLVTTTTVFAGGDQVRGGTGNGAGDQNTEEVGCEVQPCFADAPQPGPTGAGD